MARERISQGKKLNVQNEAVIGGGTPHPLENLSYLTAVFVYDNGSTFLGEKTPKVPPSSRIATPISASKASLLAGGKHL